MPRVARVMSAAEVAGLKGDGATAVGGVQGLMLQRLGASRSWLVRYSQGGVRRVVGLGAYPAVTLAQARQRALEEVHNTLAAGLDPQTVRAERLEARKPAPAVASFDALAAEFVAAKGPGWRNPKHRAQVANTLATYASPYFGSKPVADVTTEDVVRALRPIWVLKHETASRVRGRIENVLAYATVSGKRPAGLNPAQWRGHLEFMLADPSKVAKVEHHAALPYAELPAFWQRLREMDGVGAAALRFTILCAARSGEVRGATWSELDLKTATWTVPGSRMKAGKPHRVPLSPAAAAGLPASGKPTDLVFPGQRKGKPLSDMSLSAVLRRMKTEVTVHGFRSTFRDWTAERTNTPREVAEQCLAHHVGSSVEAAYRRSDLLDQRRLLMQQWADFVTGA